MNIEKINRNQKIIFDIFFSKFQGSKLEFVYVEINKKRFKDVVNTIKKRGFKFIIFSSDTVKKTDVLNVNFDFYKLTVLTDFNIKDCPIMLSRFDVLFFKKQDNLLLWSNYIIKANDFIMLKIAVGEATLKTKIKIFVRVSEQLYFEYKDVCYCYLLDTKKLFKFNELRQLDIFDSTQIKFNRIEFFEYLSKNNLIVNK